MAKATPKDQLTFGLSLVDLAHKWRRVIDNQLRPLGFSQATWRTLFFIGRGGGKIAQKDLAMNIGIEGPSLVHLLDSLEKGGLIRRKVSSTDRRANAIALTRSGEIQMQQIESVLDNVRGSLLRGLDNSQLITCMEIFESIKANALDLEELSSPTEIPVS